MMYADSDRVHRLTADEVNRRIAADMEARVHFFARSPQGIDARLRELDEEWDIERALQSNAGALAVTGTVLGLCGHSRWLLLPALVGSFLFQHAIQGWCPPLPVLRRLGFRTAEEIAEERTALKAIRGDFGPLGPDASDGDSLGAHALQAVRR